MKTEEEIRQRLFKIISKMESADTLYEDRQWLNQRMQELTWVLLDDESG